MAMAKLPDKEILVYDNVTLTDTLLDSMDAEIDPTDYDEMSIYMRYTPGTALDTLNSQVFFSSIRSEAIADYNTETDESVAVLAGIATATQVEKRRAFVSIGGAAQDVPVISIPVADARVKILLSETAAGGFGTVTVRVRLRQLR